MIPQYEKNGGMAGIRLKNTEKLEEPDWQIGSVENLHLKDMGPWLKEK